MTVSTLPPGLACPPEVQAAAREHLRALLRLDTTNPPGNEGPAIEHLASDPVFDVRSTPSRMGAISEAFRQAPGTLRSLHPTHSTCVRGPGADAIVAGHESAPAPFGDGTPFPRSQCRMLGVLADGRPAEGSDEFLLRGDGTTVPIIWVATPLRLAGRPDGLLMVFHDFSGSLPSSSKICLARSLS